MPHVAWTAAPVVALALVTALSWAWLVAGPETPMDVDGLPAAAGFLGAWTVMMAAMMVPATAPFVLLVRRVLPGRAGTATALVMAGYLLVWATAGSIALTAHLVLEPTRILQAVVLAGASAYELTPLKAWCLQRCRSPLSFLFVRWRAGRPAQLLGLGAAHGVHCAGCCWALMLVLVVAGGMGLVWVAAIAALVLAQKALPHGERLGRPLAVVLLGLAVAVLVEPGLAESLRPQIDNHMEPMP